MTSPALCDPLENGHESFKRLVSPSRLLGLRVTVRRQPRKPYRAQLARNRSELRALRLEKGWTQAHLASRSGIHVSTVTRVEGGYGFPSDDSAFRWAAALGVSRGEFDQLLDFAVEGGERKAAS